MSLPYGTYRCPECGETRTLTGSGGGMVIRPRCRECGSNMDYLGNGKP